MKQTVRLKIRGLTLFFMVSHHQTLTGITNKVSKNRYYIFWDLENCTLYEAYEELARLQRKYRLGEIFVVSDKKGSYRGWCFNQVTFKQYLHILTETKYLDWNFLTWTFQRGSATLRISNKHGRNKQKIVAVVDGYKNKIPERVTKVTYDTGLEKKGGLHLIG